MRHLVFFVDKKEKRYYNIILQVSAASLFDNERLTFEQGER